MLRDRIGRYEIRRRLGSGAFASVFEAFDPRLESTVAIKLLADNWIHEPDVRARFRQEAVLLRRVQTDHPTAPLVDVYDIDETDDGHPFFVMRLADRGSLADRRSADQPWPATDVLPVVDVLERALTTLHGAGIVHRDVKPSNLLLTSSSTGEQMLLGDLGLAKDLLVSGSALTVAGGTPRFMAPEQRDPAAPIDHRADLFAATAVIVDLLTGSPDRPQPSSGLPPHALDVFATGMSPLPGDRFRDANEWAAAMRAALQTPSPLGEQTIIAATSPLAMPTPSSSPASASKPSRRWIAALGVAAAVSIGVAIVLVTGTDDPAIIGPSSVPAGTPFVLEADVDEDDRYTWSVGGRQVDDLDLVLTPGQEGFIEVELVVTSVDGTTERSTKRVTVTE